MSEVFLSVNAVHNKTPKASNTQIL